MNPYNAVSEFEKAIAKFAGSKFAVSIDNCSNALFLCCKYLNVKKVTIPNKTYPSVPCSIIHSGGSVDFTELEWRSNRFYQLNPYQIFDAAHLFEKDMYKKLSDNKKNSYVCISFSSTKPINNGKGGMILTNDKNSVSWFQKARYCGRNHKPLCEDSFDILGWNMYMTPEQASRGLVLLSNINNIKQQEVPVYPDLSKYEVYKKDLQ